MAETTQMNHDCENPLSEEDFCQKCCDHSDLCYDELVCLICSKDMIEEMSAESYERAKNFMKYGEES